MQTSLLTYSNTLPTQERYNNIELLLGNFTAYLHASKRIRSIEGEVSNTERAYISNTKQFLTWCNELSICIAEIKETLSLRNLIIKYEGALSATKLKQNSIALKQNSVRKFFEFWDFVNGLSLDLRKCFSADFTTSGDVGAYKSQIRISEEVFNAVREVVTGANDRWIFYFLAYGCRRSEIASLRVDNVDLRNNEINIFQPKQQTYKKIPVPSWMSELPEGEYLIRSAKSYGREPVSTQYIYEKVHEWIGRTKYKGTPISCHSFRRYFVGSLKGQGVSDSNIAQLGGWGSTAQIIKYGYDSELEANPIIKNKLIKY